MELTGDIKTKDAPDGASFVVIQNPAIVAGKEKALPVRKKENS